MHCRAQLLIPAAILIIDKIVGFARDQVALFNQSQAIGTGFGIAIFNLLDKAGDSNLKKLSKLLAVMERNFRRSSSGLFSSWASSSTRRLKASHDASRLR